MFSSICKLSLTELFGKLLSLAELFAHRLKKYFFETKTHCPLKSQKKWQVEVGVLKKEEIRFLLASGFKKVGDHIQV